MGLVAHVARVSIGMTTKESGLGESIDSIVEYNAAMLTELWPLLAAATAVPLVALGIYKTKHPRIKNE